MMSKGHEEGFGLMRNVAIDQHVIKRHREADLIPVIEAHPDLLGTIATLLGLKPASAAQCRVLEIGCATGGNLVPMALTLPESNFVGIDASAVQIQQAQQLAFRMGDVEGRASGAGAIAKAAADAGEHVGEIGVQ